MERTIARRGPGWRDTYVRYAQGWHLKRCSGGPIQNVDDVIRLFEWRNQHSPELRMRWPGETLILDAVRTPLQGLKADHLRRAAGWGRRGLAVHPRWRTGLYRKTA